MAEAKDNRADARAARAKPELSDEDQFYRLGSDELIRLGSTFIDTPFESLMFKFADEQWANIKEELVDLRPELSQAELQEIRRKLEGIASEYLLFKRLEVPRAASRRKTLKRRQMRIAKIKKELLALLSDEFDVDGLARQVREVTGTEIVPELRLAVVSESNRHEYLDLIKLKDLQIRESAKPSHDLRVWFQYLVLKVWTDLGGKLTWSYSSGNKERGPQIGGPLVRYFLAGVSPMIGDEPPSAKSIQKIVGRQKILDDICREECISPVGIWRKECAKALGIWSSLTMPIGRSNKDLDVVAKKARLLLLTVGLRKVREPLSPSDHD